MIKIGFQSEVWVVMLTALQRILSSNLAVAAHQHMAHGTWHGKWWWVLWAFGVQHLPHRLTARGCVYSPHARVPAPAACGWVYNPHVAAHGVACSTGGDTGFQGLAQAGRTRVYVQPTCKGAGRTRGSMHSP